MDARLILGVGTVALDTVETPAGSVRDAPGGSALYFGAAVSLDLPVSLVGVTGEDFPSAPLERLAARGVDVSGIVRLPRPTFRWRARYDEHGVREVLSVHRGGTVRTPPVIPMDRKDPGVLFLGSTDPSVQAEVLAQAGRPGLVLLDSMPHWIRDGRATLAQLLPAVDVFLANEEEVRLLGGVPDEAEAAEAVQALGAGWVVVKRGAGGARAYGRGTVVEVPAAAVPRVVDPTGAGDAFAGGLASSLASTTAEASTLTPSAMEAAMLRGARAGALAVAAFGFEALLSA